MIKVGDMVKVNWKDSLDGSKTKTYFGRIIKKYNRFYIAERFLFEVVENETNYVLVCYPDEIKKITTLCA
jgi:hypothetical protein